MSELIEVALSKLSPSPFNPRKTHDKAFIAELGADLLLHGVLQPLVVRPLLVAGQFELIFGHSRLEAAKLAGLKTVPCIVRKATDAEASELQLVENLKRKDLDAFELAEGYGRLRDTHKLTAEAIAKKVGRSERSVHESLQLVRVLDDVRAQLLEKKLPFTQCLMVARLPMGVQKQAAKELVDGRYGNDGPMTVQDARAWVAEKYMADLRNAPFDRDDEKLCPSAGSCKACPKRSGNMGSAVDVVEAEGVEKKKHTNLDRVAVGRDVCFDTACYRLKLVAGAKVEAAKRGVPLLSEKETKEAFNQNGWLQSEAFVEASKQDYGDAKNRQFKQLLDKDHLKQHLCLAVTPRGEVTEVLVKDGLEKAIKASGKKESPKHRSPANSGPKVSKEDRVKEEAKRELQAKVAELAIAAVVTAVDKKGLTPKLLRLVAEEISFMCNGDAFDRRKQQSIKQVKDAQLPGLIFELAFDGQWGDLYGGFPASLTKCCKELGVDLKKLEAQAAKPAGKKAA